MSRRGGKAASRRARLQRRARQSATPGSAAARPAPSAPAPAPAPAPTPATAPSAPSLRPVVVTGSMGTSRLGEAAHAEYHYVARDLRNTGILVLVMAALLAVAVVVVNLTGIAPS